MNSRLHKKPGHPYYVYALDYRETSSGICALHYLCHALNLQGFEAYVTGTQLRNETLKTPLLTSEIEARHVAQGRVPIAIYPEVVTGNPLSAPVVVRYMLNKEGVVSGNRIDASENDLFFYFSSAFVPDLTQSYDYLTVPMLDSELFKARSVEPSQRTAKLLYLNRIPTTAVDFSVLPADIELLSMQSPLTLEQLADRLGSAQVLYSYELSSTCTIAMLCGCPVVTRNLAGYERLGFSEQNLSILQGNGYSSSDDPDELYKVRASLAEVARIYQRIEDDFWAQLTVFGTKTQASAEHFARKKGLVVRDWLSKRTLTSTQQTLIDQRLVELPPAPLRVLIRASGATRGQVADTLASLKAVGRSSAIQPWLLADGDFDSGGLDCDVLEVKGEGVIASINASIASGGFDWLLLVDAGTRFLGSGLVQVELSLGDTGSCRAFYPDELHEGEGDLGGAFRPDFNLDLFLSLPSCMTRHWLFERETLLGMGGFDSSLPGAYEFDFILRMVEQEGFAAIGHLDEPLAVFSSPTLTDKPDEILAIEAHLNRRGYLQGKVLPTLPGRYRLDYGHAERPLVSIIVQMRDQLPFALRCVTSILERTRYEPFELLIVDNGSRSPEARAWLEGIGTLGTHKVRVLTQPCDGNRSRLSNLAAAAARGDYLVFLGSDVAVLQDDWLEGLLNHAMRPEVAVVGAKQFDSTERIRHAGLLLGLRGAANSPFVGESRDASGYMQRLQVDQNYSAVEDTCMMISRALYVELGGMDEQRFSSHFGVVDLCLRAAQAGLLTVWTPHVQCLRGGGDEQSEDYTGADRAFHDEQDGLFRKWLPAIAHDPSYNANLSLNGNGFQLELDSDLNWRPLSWRPLPVVMAHMGDYTGCGHYRVIKPFQAMEQAALVDGKLSPIMHGLADMGRYAPDSIVMQRQLSEHFHDWIRRLGASTSIFKVYELDDYLPNLPLKSVHRGSFSKDTLRSLRKSLGLVDRFVVSTEPLAEALAGMHADIRVVKNRLPLDWWGALSSVRRQGGKPRVGWAGGSGHTGDLELIADVVKDLAGEVDWIFFGMCPDALRPFVHEFHAGVAIDQYPAKLASLDLDLALAPLEDNLFNRCKSNLRLLEYGICGFPVICTDIEPYRDGFAVTRVRNRYKEWVDAIRAHLGDLDATAAMGDRLRSQVLADWMLSGENLKGWRAAWLPD